ncbi:MAG TPA: peptidoglycan DD-metalloendopeptidase family protein, partial [Gemmatimonadales bacterium]|nr:peptidoglycan DD-metalloendopeptidase family protein [Gemmatimonadales bacterium]
MPVRGRPRFGRRSILASSLATLLVLMGAGTVLAGTSNAPAVPDARVMRPGATSGYRLPFAPGLEIPIEQGWNSSYSHNGRSAYAYDFGLQLNTPVLAAASGVVSYVHSGETACGGADLRDHANYVTINHPDGSATQYGHLGAVEVKVGQVVQVGQEIGRSGRTGFTGCMPHLHFARQVQGGP